MAKGIYKENIDFSGKAVTIESEKGPKKTVIDGASKEAVVKIVSGEGPNSVLEGFTITNGFGGGIVIQNSSPTIKGDVITANVNCEGLGISVTDGFPIIENNTITKNTQDCSGGFGGGGILVSSSTFNPAAVVRIMDNQISGNFLNSGGGGISTVESNVIISGNTITNNVAGRGCGVAIDGGSALVQNNIITGNNTDNTGSGGFGAGIAVSGGAVAQIRNNTISGNSHTDDGFGGGIAAFGAQSITVIDNLITGNSASFNGGGMSISGGQALVMQNIIAGNTSNTNGADRTYDPGAYETGSAVFDYSVDLTLVNNTIVGNTVGESLTSNRSEIFIEGRSNNVIQNNIVYSTTADVCVFGWPFQQVLGPTTFASNDVFNAVGGLYGGVITDQTGANGNISADPSFADLGKGDFHLSAHSPCIDSGNNKALSLPDADFDGNPRIADGNGDGTATVDMGAYELPVPTVTGLSIQGKNVVVTGKNFDGGSVILLNGVAQKTARVGQPPPVTLIGKKLVKQIAHGQMAAIQVENSSGAISNEVELTRP